MNIAIHTGGMPFNGATIPNGESLGGSESAGYYMAKELAALGHQVTIYTNSQATGKWDGVIYEWAGERSQSAPLGERFHFAMNVPHDVVVVQRQPTGFTFPINAKLTYLWLHDLALHRYSSMLQPSLMRLDGILTVSEFHRKQVSDVYDLPMDFITATTNGVDYEPFKRFADYDREPRSLVYMARPERGLENLVGEDSIMERLPDCHLYVCGYDNTVPQMEAYYKYLWKRCDDLPNVTNLGALGKTQLYELLSKSMLYVYPTEFEDTSCIAVLEANAAGTPVIGSNWSAVPETMQDGGAKLLDLKDGKVNKKRFANTVKKILDNPNEWDKLHQQALNKSQSWSDAAKQWDELFTAKLADKSSNKYRLHKHLEKMSDIKAAIHDGAEKTLPDLKDNYYFVFNKDYAGHYARYYEYEKSKGVKYGPQDLANDPNQRQRFLATLNLVKSLPGKSLIEYGCAHGHYTMNLAHHTDIDSLTGWDICQDNINKARKWAADAKVTDRVKFFCGEHNDIPEADMCDIMVAEEVLEHVDDPISLSETLIKHVNPGGTMIISVPYGPWESIGYDANPGWRAHIHHFERQDLLNIYGTQDDYKIIALPCGPDMGHYLVSFKPNGKPLGSFDYDYKLRTQAPAETLSVCIICKDGEHELGKPLEKIALVADEIIVGIDNKTTDRTKELAESYGAITFSIQSPLEQGFDEARNETIKRATMDWILWIDADETIENAHGLKRYLRNNAYTGYAIKQHHYAIEPPALFQTDYPVRIFRNHKGIKFFGVVHEHPEFALNEGIGKVCILPDVAIMHNGYATEAIRRDRFKRNFPLMMRDRQKYPDRILGKFLWLRDLVYCNQYEMERNGRRITEEMRKRARAAIVLFHDLMTHDNARLVCEGLKYYSEAVKTETNGTGIEAKIGLSFNIGNEADEPKILTGHFLNQADVSEFTDYVIKDNTKKHGDRYY